MQLRCPSARPQAHPCARPLSLPARGHPVHTLTLMLHCTSRPTPELPRVLFPAHMRIHMQSLIPMYSFTHLHFLSHPCELLHRSPYNARQLSPMCPAATHQFSLHAHVLCLQMPSPVTQLLLAWFTHVRVSCHMHICSQVAQNKTSMYQGQKLICW